MIDWPHECELNWTHLIRAMCMATKLIDCELVERCARGQGCVHQLIENDEASSQCITNCITNWNHYTEPCARGLHELLLSKLTIDCKLIWLKPRARRRSSFTSRKQLWSKLMIDCELILLERCARKAHEKRQGSWTTMDASFWFTINCELIYLEPCVRLQNSC